jgi:hypothetical protein
MRISQRVPNAVCHVMHHRKSVEPVGRGDALSLQPRTASGPTRDWNEGHRSLTSLTGSPTWEVHRCHPHSSVISEGVASWPATAHSIDVWVRRPPERGASPPVDGGAGAASRDCGYRPNEEYI